ncbi:DUF5996 family protein [Alkalibacterium kapii]|uniref:Uncharacterized protein n=1 Tax=Alkalibacterium kapii TaxID=426704 RepID=A0A511ARQ6_9LACT|nr:DUF5996 family protein [Alkalibacterium kapii]GEK90889.1 hypothetical protein AKA01nite_05110 [Alkalibacterium kapii]
MGFYRQNKEEITTLHLLSQIIGKVRLEHAAQEPQWAHVILGITSRGFSTGLLESGSQFFEIEVDLVNDQIIFKTRETESSIALSDGKTISEYYHEIINMAAANNLNLSINKKPQEMKWQTPFDEDTTHHHYNSDVASQILEWFQFAWNALQQFITPVRQRKIYPGLFWGTFDIACLLVYDEHTPFPDDSKVIERAAFDEPMIEFSFWLGDDNIENPAFFTLPYAFVEKEALETGESFPQGSYFSQDMGEYVYEMTSDLKNTDTQDVIRFIEASCRKSIAYFEWQNTHHVFKELKMEENENSK